MEPFLEIVGAGTVLLLFVILSVLFGTDTRDGFTERTVRPIDRIAR